MPASKVPRRPSLPDDPDAPSNRDDVVGVGNLSEPDTDGRRARGRATRAAILTAATTLFAQHGYSATSLTAIAAASGTKTASIHHAFGNKEGLLAAVMEKVGDAMFDLIGRVIAEADSPAARITAVMAALAERPKFLRLFLLLTLERQDGNPTLLRTVEQIRARGRLVVGQAIADLVSDLAPPVRARISEEFGRLALIILDGVFLSQQIDGENAYGERTYELAAIALEAALRHLIGEAPTASGAGSERSSAAPQ